MGGNFHTGYADGVTIFAASVMEAPLSELDRALSYGKNVIVHCDGTISYSNGQLTWSDTLRIFFVRADGQLTQNTVATGGVTLADGQMAYVDLSETNDAVASVLVASLTTGSASTTKAFNRLVLGYRNAASDAFYPVGIRMPLQLTGDMTKATYDTDNDGKVDAAESADAARVNTFPIGDGTDATILIQAYNADTNKPGIRYSAGDNKWQYSNDGSTWADIGSGGGGGAAFKTISVSGQSDVVAEAAEDTLTLVAGSNVSITTDATTDTVTISASGGTTGSVNLWQLLL